MGPNPWPVWPALCPERPLVVAQAAPTAGALECGRALVCRLVSQSRASALFTGSAAGLLWTPRWGVGEVWVWSLILSIFMACVSFTKWEPLGQGTEAVLSKQPSGDRHQAEGAAPESAGCFSRSTTLLLRDWAQPEAWGAAAWRGKRRPSKQPRLDSRESH